MDSSKSDYQIDVKQVVIDINMVFDSQTLLFCILRKHLAYTGTTLSNSDYELIVNQEFHQAIEKFNQKFPQISEQNEKFEEQIREEYTALLPTVKPMIPSLQLIDFLKKSDVKVSLDSFQIDKFVLDKLSKQFQGIMEEFLNVLPLDDLAAVDGNTLLFSSSLEHIKSLKQRAAGDESKLKSIYVVPKKLEGLDEGILEQLIGTEVDISNELKIGNRYSDLTAVPFQKMFPEFPGFIETKKYVDYSDTQVIEDLPEFKQWFGCVPIAATDQQDQQLIITGQVVDGYKRGSKQLGVPTANIEMTEENQLKTRDLVPGVYAAYGTFPESKDADKEGKVFSAALSIGWNPMYDNAQKTVEVFLLNTFPEDFYGDVLQIELKQFIRGEALFGNFDTLILAIQSDIEVSRVILEKEK